MHLRDSVVGLREEEKETDVLPMSAAGKKRPLLGSGGGTRKKATASPTHEKPYSLRSFLKPMDRRTEIVTGTVTGTPFEFDSGDETATQLVEVKHGDQAGTLILDDSPDESDPISFKRKRSLRLKTQNQLSFVKEEPLKANTGGCSKRRRADAQKSPGEQDREPSVTLPWKHWCMYEEDGEEIDVLVNKRDERRRLERQNELQRQEQKENGTADSTKIGAPENVMSSNNEAQVTADRTREEVKDESQTLELPLVTESGASHVVSLASGFLQVGLSAGKATRLARFHGNHCVVA